MAAEKGESEKSLGQLANDVTDAKRAGKGVAEAFLNLEKALMKEIARPHVSEQQKNSFENDLEKIRSEMAEMTQRQRSSASDGSIPKPERLTEKQNAESEGKVQTLPRSAKDKWNKFVDKFKGTESKEGKVQDVSKDIEQKLSQRSHEQPSKTAEQGTNSAVSKTPTFKIGGHRA